MIADKEVTDRGEINFTGGADVTPIVDVLYGSLPVCDPTLTSNPRLLEDQVLVVYDTAPELLN